MAKRETLTVPDAAKSRTSEVRRRIKRDSTQVAVYSECSITVCVDRTSNEFLKFTFGHERLSPSDSEADLLATEKKAWLFNEKVVDQRARKIKRLISSIASERG